MFKEKTEKAKTSGSGKQSFVTTRNACKLCAPLGASIVFKGIKGCLPMLHGSQGCATYIRRYMISHFKEPVDIASSNFSEEATIFGGSKNFNTGIDNVIRQYHPAVIAIASTCLSETIGEDVAGLIRAYRTINADKDLPVFIQASTASYRGSHMDGFHEAILATVKTIARKKYHGDHFNVIPGFISPADIRHLKEILDAFGMKYVMFPDYSETLDGEHWKEYQLIPEGGTPPEAISHATSAKATFELGATMHQGTTAGNWLLKSHRVSLVSQPLPIGIKLTDLFVDAIKEKMQKDLPKFIKKERGRLIDAYVDGHKYVFGKRAFVYGEEDLVVSMVSFLSEIGIKTVVAGSGGNSGRLKEAIAQVTDDTDNMVIMNKLDFEQMNELADKMEPDILIGNSKGYYIARRLKKPLIRVGFPIHDRFDGHRLQHLCYEGTQRLFDRIVNAFIEYKQENSPVGYNYL